MMKTQNKTSLRNEISLPNRLKMDNWWLDFEHDHMTFLDRLIACDVREKDYE